MTAMMRTNNNVATRFHNLGFGNISLANCSNDNAKKRSAAAEMLRERDLEIVNYKIMTSLFNTYVPCLKHPLVKVTCWPPSHIKLPI